MTTTPTLRWFSNPIGDSLQSVGWRFINSDCLPGLRVILLTLLLILIKRGAWAESPTGLELLGRGINYGNMLEAPSEGEWGLRFQDDFPRLVKQAGFDSVRVPVRWSAHAALEAPYAIDAEFMERVKHVVDLSLAEGLKVVLNVHHYDEIFREPSAHRQRFLAIWSQIAEEFQGANSRLFFELLNEPHDQLSAEIWNEMLVATIDVIRPLHPDRWLIVGPDHWNGVSALPSLVLPESDRKLIVTVHYYLPFPFTHQGASWVDPPPPLGTQWRGTESEVAEIVEHLTGVAKWAEQHQRPIYVGEFGAYERADMPSRARWTRTVRSECEKQGFAWAYWELGSGFGAWNPRTRQWRDQLLEALIGN